MPWAFSVGPHPGAMLIWGKYGHLLLSVTAEQEAPSASKHWINRCWKILYANMNYCTHRRSPAVLFPQAKADQLPRQLHKKLMMDDTARRAGTCMSPQNFFIVNNRGVNVQFAQTIQTLHNRIISLDALTSWVYLKQAPYTIHSFNQLKHHPEPRCHHGHFNFNLYLEFNHLVSLQAQGCWFCRKKVTIPS